MSANADTDRSVRLWFLLSMVVSAVAVAVYLRGMMLPGSWEFDPLAIDDDARQFLTWMPRLRDPALLRDDLLADYWWSVSPPLYRLGFQAVAALGIDPVLAARLMPCTMIPLATLAAWWGVRGLLDRPEIAFLATLLLLLPFHLRPEPFTPAPRVFAEPLFLLFLGALLRDRAWVMVVAIALMAALYPASAVVSLSLLGLSRLRAIPRLGIDVSPRSLMLVLGAAVVALAIALPFLSASQPWQPTVTLEEARGMSNFMSYQGRSRIVLQSGEIGWLCSGRIGFLPAVATCKRPFDLATFANLALMLPALALLVRAVRQGRAADRREILLYGGVWVVAAVWFAVAALVAFKLHLPSRYSQRALRVVEMIGIAQAFAVWVQPWLARYAPRSLRLGGVAMAAFALVAFAWPKTFERPKDRAAMESLAATAPDAKIGGVSDELAFVPSLLGRSVVATPEHAIPYHLGYYRQIERRLSDMLQAATTPDPAEMRAILTRYDLDVFAVDRAFLLDGAFPKYFARTIPEQADRAAARIAVETPALARRAEACMRFRGESLLLLDARCLAGR